MVLWWLGNLIFVFVVIPIVVILLSRLWNVVREIKEYVDDVLEHGVLLISGVDDVELLLDTREQARILKENVQRYGSALDALL